MRDFRIFRSASAGLVALSLVAPTVALADASSADISRMTKRSAAEMAAIAPQDAADLAASRLARDARQAVRACVDKATTAVARNLGDLSEVELAGVRNCIASVLEGLAAKMQGLKAMARNAAFEYGAFAETVRLLVSTRDPAARAVEPMRAMLRAADAATANRAEKLAILRLVEVTNELTGVLDAPAA